VDVDDVFVGEREIKKNGTYKKLEFLFKNRLRNMIVIIASVDGYG